MAHIDEGTLQAYLDDEVAARAEVDAHLAACTECAAELARLGAASQLFATAVHSADAKAPTYAALNAVKARRSPPLRTPEFTQRRTFTRMPLARAALLVIGLAAVASAAIPGSPVRALIADALRFVTGADKDETAVVPPRVDTEVAEPVFDSRSDLSAALSIQPVQGRVRVVLSSGANAATVRVRVVDSDRATVHASGAAAQARFRTGPGRIEVTGIEGGEITVDVPRSASNARVELDGRLIFEKDRGQLHLNESASTGPNQEFVFKP